MVTQMSRYRTKITPFLCIFLIDLWSPYQALQILLSRISSISHLLSYLHLLIWFNGKKSKIQKIKKNSVPAVETTTYSGLQDGEARAEDWGETDPLLHCASPEASRPVASVGEGGSPSLARITVAVDRSEPGPKARGAGLGWLSPRNLQPKPKPKPPVPLPLAPPLVIRLLVASSLLSTPSLYPTRW